MLTPTERKRQGYIHELIVTEENYVNDLQLVTEVRQLCRLGPLLSLRQFSPCTVQSYCIALLALPPLGGLCPVLICVYSYRYSCG